MGVIIYLKDMLKVSIGGVRLIVDFCFYVWLLNEEYFVLGFKGEMVYIMKF